MNKITIFFLMCVVLLSLASAQQQDLGTFQQYSDIELIQTCSNCSYVNITNIKLANLSILNINEEMTKNDIFYNWTLISNYTDSLGDYYVTGFGDLDGDITSFIYSFSVTPSGTEVSSAFAVPLLIPILLTILFSLLFFFLATKINGFVYKWVFIIFGAFSFVLTVSFSILAARDSLWGFPVLYNFVDVIYKIFIIFTPVSAVIVSIITMIFIIKTVFNKKGYMINTNGDLI